jgi:hypothetical protein
MLPAAVHLPCSMDEGVELEKLSLYLTFPQRAYRDRDNGRAVVHPSFSPKTAGPSSKPTRAG